MLTLTAGYDFTTDLSLTTLSDPANFSASPTITKAGTGTTVTWSSSGWMVFLPATTSGSDLTHYFIVTITPSDPAMPWTPTDIVFRANKVHTSTTQGIKLHTSKDAYAAEIWYTYLTSTMAAYTASLSSIGTMTGPLTIRVGGWAGSTSAVLNIDSVTVHATYTPTGAVDQSVVVASVGSSEAFGTASVVVPAALNLSPDSIAPTEAFGPPTVAVVALVAISTAGGIGSTEAFGPPTVAVVALVAITGAGGITTGEGFGSPALMPGVVGSKPYPDAERVAAFLGAPGNAAVLALAAIHVGVITTFASIYTRGQGFYVDGVAEPIAGVILAATARLVGNPEQLDITVGSVRRASFFKGWSLAEQRVLNEYRGVAA